jgi:hypothetical protein
LSLLKSFDALLKAASRISNLGCWTKITNLLDGIIYFYSHHKPQVKQKIEQAKSLARGEIFLRYFTKCHNFANTAVNSDVPNADMERLDGSIESGLSLILEKRQTLSAFVNTIKPIEKILQRMSNLMDSSECCPLKTTGNQLQDMGKRINQHQKLCVIPIAEASESIIQLSDRREVVNQQQ